MSRRPVFEGETVFVDSGAWIALLSRGDEHHVRAVEILRELLSQRQPLITTEAVVLEVGDGLSAPRRRQFSMAFRALLDDPSVEIVPISLYLEESWELFESRRDKEWSLTDCFSFVVMKHHQLRDAFAHDHHFEQAGFRALLRQN